MKSDYSDDIRMNEVDFDLGRYIAWQSALSSRKLRKYELLSGKDILPTDAHREVEKQLFEHTPLGAKLDEQGKKFEKQGKDIVGAIERT